MQSAASNGNAGKNRPEETDPDLICQAASAGCPVLLLPGAIFIAPAEGPLSLPPCANSGGGDHKIAVVFLKPAQTWPFPTKNVGLNCNSPRHRLHSSRCRGRSVWHMPLATTRTSTSSASGSARVERVNFERS
jgi:hypothetical protein